MGRFSESIGLESPRSFVQSDSLDIQTRTALWNSFHSFLTHLERTSSNSSHIVLLRHLWADFFEHPVDEFRQGLAVSRVKDAHLTGPWNRTLDLVQWMIDRVANAAYLEGVETDFERYLVGYRIVGGSIVPVSDPVEAAAVSEVMALAGSGARTHIKRAVQLLANREAPQYAKVIAEAVNAVESTVREVTGERVLSDGLKKLEKSGVAIHPALRDGWIKLYGYTSDADGIRHALVRDEDANESLAVYFLVSCSAFVNFLLKHSK